MRLGFSVPTPEGVGNKYDLLLVSKRSLTSVYIVFQLIKIKISWTKPLILFAIGLSPAIRDIGHNIWSSSYR
jgi:hypothetical protein